MATAKVFWLNRSQAVRLPKDFWFDTSTVHICRRGTTVILKPITENWSWLHAIQGKLDNDFVAAVNETRTKTSNFL